MHLRAYLFYCTYYLSCYTVHRIHFTSFYVSLWYGKRRLPHILHCYFCGTRVITHSLRWRHNGCDGVSNHQPHDSLLNRLFRRRPKKTSKFRVTGLCVGNSPGTGEFPAQMASNAENVSIWWRHRVKTASRHDSNVFDIVVITATSDDISDYTFGTMTTLGFQYTVAPISVVILRK